MGASDSTRRQESTGSGTAGVARRCESSRLLRLSWWCAGGPLLTRDGVGRLIDALAARLPEALPGGFGCRSGRLRPSRRWLEDLACYIDCERDGALMLRSAAPVLGVDLQVPASWGEGRAGFEATFVEIELDGRVLDRSSWRRRLPSAFEAVSAAVQPFYGEARLYPEAARSEHGGWSSPYLRPISRSLWRGFPRVPAFAAVVGPPYLSAWTHADGGRSRAGLLFHSSAEWPAPPPGGVPAAPDCIAQEFDAHYIYLGAGEAGAGGAEAAPAHAGGHERPPWGRADPARFEPERARHGFAIRRPATTPPVWPFAALAALGTRRSIALLSPR